MDNAMVEQLLHEEEGPALDFKRDQYPFAKATDEEKAELLKDILGFANAWRRTDAYILIGVKEVRGGRSHVHGVAEHLNDHSLQQFINHLTNRPLRFQYEAVTVDGLQVGVLRIELQERPFYLKRDFGKLRRGEVYVRRGSSTDPTSPATADEIAQMGRSVIAVTAAPEIQVELADPERNTRLGASTSWEAVALGTPSDEEVPNYQSYTGSDPIQRALTMMGSETTNVDYYRDVRDYIVFSAIFRPLRLAVINTGPIAASDVRVELDVPRADGIRLLEASDEPSLPRPSSVVGDIPAMRNIRTIHRHPGEIDITQHTDRAHVEIDCGGLQPGRTIWTDKFFAAVDQSGSVSITGRIFAAALSEPKEFVLTVATKISERNISVEELRQIADAALKED
jgi:hypothetical protein